MSRQRKISADLLRNEFVFTTSRSGGPGGQNVNKVNSKVTLHFNVADSGVLTPEEKEVILIKLASRLTREGVLTLTAEESRSQLKNKALVVEKLQQLLIRAFEKKKPRRPTKPSKGSVQDRIKKKKEHAEKKRWRRKPDADR